MKMLSQLLIGWLHSNARAARVFRVFLKYIRIGATSIDPQALLNITIMMVGISLSYQISQFRKEMNDFRGSVVFDVDLMRKELSTEMDFMYMQGCTNGTNYPEEYRDVDGFNTNSPLNWCGKEKTKTWDEYITEKTFYIGRKSQQ